jgi:hypothetical protein
MTSNRMRWGATFGRGASILFLASVQLACSGRGAKSAHDDLTRRDTRIVHESCGSGEEIDANGDRRPDVVIAKSGGREVCRAVDLNFDGTMDSWIYRDGGGQIRRRETDYDRDGRVDEIAVYQGGVIVEKQRATTLANKLDTWQFFKGGALARTERDADGDEVVDQWWEYQKPGCPTIHSDVDGDGRPDPGATVDYCKETGYVPPDRQPYRTPTSPDFQKPGSLPTEVDSKEMGAPGGASGSPPGGSQTAPANAGDQKKGPK